MYHHIHMYIYIYLHPVYVSYLYMYICKPDPLALTAFSITCKAKSSVPYEPSACYSSLLLFYMLVKGSQGMP